MERFQWHLPGRLPNPAREEMNTSCATISVTRQDCPLVWLARPMPRKPTTVCAGAPGFRWRHDFTTPCFRYLSQQSPPATAHALDARPSHRITEEIRHLYACRASRASVLGLTSSAHRINALLRQPCGPVPAKCHLGMTALCCFTCRSVSNS